MKIVYKKGLLYASLEIIYKGKRKIVDDIIIDTIKLCDHEIKNIKVDFGL